jgi:hypothetical protein
VSSLDLWQNAQNLQAIANNELKNQEIVAMSNSG